MRGGGTSDPARECDDAATRRGCFDPSDLAIGAMSRVSRWLHRRGSFWIHVLEVLVRALNALLLGLGLAALAWSVYTGVALQHQAPQPAPAPAPQPPPLIVARGRWNEPGVAASPWGGLRATTTTSSSSNAVPCPWFVPAIGAVGGATAASAALAMMATCLQNVGCMTAHIFVMSVVLVAQACVAVAIYADQGWQQRLPDTEEAVKEWLAQRLDVCKWVGVGLAALQLATLAVSCLLHGAYHSVDEAAEEEDDEAAARAAPLLRAQHAPGSLLPSGGRHDSATAAARAGMDVRETADWASHMRRHYGLDPAQFGGGQPQAAAARDGGGGGRGCSVM